MTMNYKILEICDKIQKDVDVILEVAKINEPIGFETRRIIASEHIEMLFENDLEFNYKSYKDIAEINAIRLRDLWNDTAHLFIHNLLSGLIEWSVCDPDVAKKRCREYLLSLQNVGLDAIKETALNIINKVDPSERDRIKRLSTVKRAIKNLDIEKFKEFFENQSLRNDGTLLFN